MEDQKPSRHRAPEDVRRQKRKELDARRSKSRIRLGTHLEQWCNVKDQLGFHLHSDFAKFLLDSYTCKSPMTGSGSGVTGEDLNVLHTSSDALRQLVIWSHDHSRECGFIPDLKSVVLERSGGSLTAVWECIAGHSYPWLLQASALATPERGVKVGTRTRERVLCSSAEHGDPPEGEHHLRAPDGIPLESTVKMEREPRSLVSESSGGSERGSESDSSERGTAPGHERQPHGSTGIGGEGEADCENSAAPGQGGLATPQHPSPAQGHNSTSPILASRRTRNKNQQCSRSGSWASPVSEASGLGDAAPNSKHSARRKRTATGTASNLDTTHVCESNWATDVDARPGSSKAEVIPVSEFQAAASPDRNDGDLEVREESDEDKVVGIEESTDDDLSYADDLKDQNYCPSSDSSDRTKRRLQARLRVRPPKEPPNNEKPQPSPPEPRKGRRVRRVQSEETPIPKRRIRRTRRVQSEESQITMKKIRKKAPKEILRCEFEGCGKIVSNRQYLKHHMKYQHLLQRTFACSHPSCGRSFNFKKHLKEHEKLHSDKRDYICEFCARAFRTTSNLIIHRRIHTGEKPLQCEICGFTCRQKASLNWHMKKHDAESGYQFSCDICGKKFEKKDNVNAHKSKSHPVTPVIVP